MINDENHQISMDRAVLDADPVCPDGLGGWGAGLNVMIEERARKIERIFLDRLPFGIYPSHPVLDLIADELRAVHREGMLRAAEIAEEDSEVERALHANGCNCAELIRKEAGEL